MQPGSLIFLVIVAVWAVYLVQHWIRRREHVATARSVDRFSEAMRVLERRTPLPRTELATPRPHSYAVRPPSARPALVVKRAPLATAPAPRREAERPAVAASRARRMRGIALLVTLGALVVTLTLAVAHVLLWVSVAVSGAAFVLVLAWLRIAAGRERAARRSSQRVRRWTEERVAARAEVTEVETEAPVAGAAVAEAAVAGAPVAEAPVAEAPEDEVYDVTAPAPGSEAALAGVPSTQPWSPVPVPPPTYTLKETAARPSYEPAAYTPVPVAQQVPVPIEVEDDELERLMAERHRRIVG